MEGNSLLPNESNTWSWVYGHGLKFLVCHTCQTGKIWLTGSVWSAPQRKTQNPKNRITGFSLVFSTTGKGPFQTSKAHLQLQAAGHSQLCQRYTFRFRGWTKQSKILFKTIVFDYALSKLLMTETGLPSISGDIFGVTYMAYRWKISGVSYESHRYEIESHRIAEFVF